MLKITSVAAVCVIGLVINVPDAQAAEYDANPMACVNGVCQPIPIVDAQPPCTRVVGEFIRPVTTYDQCGRPCTKWYVVRRYAKICHPYIPCGD